MALITDNKLRQLYEKAARYGMPPDGMPLLKEFIKLLFESLPAAGYIDEHNNMNFDEFMLPGSNTRKLYAAPELEKDNATDK